MSLVSNETNANRSDVLFLIATNGCGWFVLPLVFTFPQFPMYFAKYIAGSLYERVESFSVQFSERDAYLSPTPQLAGKSGSDGSFEASQGLNVFFQRLQTGGP